MNTQYTRLSMIPSGVLPVIYMSQYDVGRPIGFICDEDLDSYTVTLEATRTDGTAITAAVTTDGNIGAFVTTATMTNVADEYPAQVVITDSDSNRVASITVRCVVTVAAMDENAEAIEEDASLYQQYTSTVQGLIASVRASVATEAASRAVADTAEATARAEADEDLQDAIDAEEAARISADALLQSQITQIVSPSGSAPSEAEVTDARIDYYGAAHATVGEAIRSIDKASADTLSEILDTNVLMREGQLTVSKSSAATWQYSLVATLALPSGTTALYMSCKSITYSNTAIANKISVVPVTNGTDGSAVWVTVFPATISIPSGADSVKIYVYTNNGSALNTSVVLTDFCVTYGGSLSVSLNDDLRESLTEEITESGVVLSADTDTYTVGSAGTWQRRQWAVTDIQPCDKVRVQYDSITYSNTTLAQNNCLLAFYNGSTLVTQYYISTAAYADNTYVVPGTADRFYFYYYANTNSAVNTSATITGLKLTLIRTGGLENRVMNLDGGFYVHDYYRANNYLNGKADTIKNLMINADGQYDSFIFITDMHWRGNAKQSPALIKWLRDNCRINRLVNGGDMYDAWDGLTTDAIDDINKAWGSEAYSVVGNHEFNHIGVGISNGGLTEAKCWYLFNSLHDDIVVGDAERNYYYLDNEQQKIRYIVLSVYTDAGEGEEQAATLFEAAQQTWFRDTALGTLTAGWIAVILPHVLFEINPATDAIIKPDFTAPIETIVDSYSGPGQVAFILTGHCHRDRITSTSGGVPVVITTCDKYATWTTSDGYADINTTRTPGTITEQAFDVVVVDRKNRKASFIRIGAPALDGIDNNPGDPVEVRTINF